MSDKIVVYGPLTRAQTNRKQKKNKNKNKKRRSRKSKPQTMQMHPTRKLQGKLGPNFSAHGNMIKQMCNPFSSGANQCKYPDGTTTNSLSIQVRGLYSVLSNATGYQLTQFTTDYPYQYNGQNALASNVYTLGSAQAETFTNTILDTLAASGSKFRTTCAGIIIRPIQNAMTAQGSIIITELPVPLPPSSVWTSGTLYGDAKSTTIFPGNESVFIFKPQGVTARQYHAENTSTTTVSSWSGVLIEIIGAVDAVAVLEVEYVMNVEIEVGNNQAYQSLAPKSPAMNTTQMQVISKVQQSTGTIFIDKATKVAEKLASQGMMILADYMTDGMFTASGGRNAVQMLTNAD
jgi:gamma-glutamylcyclotransferase (GGCT)/AIG2-like uncharacterized protein YtfP